MEGLIENVSDDDSSSQEKLLDDTSMTVATTATTSTTKSGKRRKRKKKASIDDLKHRVSQLMQVFEEQGIFIPLPESTDGQKKTWSNRNYGADKKRQRKNVERELLEARILQLESCLESQRPDVLMYHWPWSRNSKMALFLFEAVSRFR